MLVVRDQGEAVLAGGGNRGGTLALVLMLRLKWCVRSEGEERWLC